MLSKQAALPKMVGTSVSRWYLVTSIKVFGLHTLRYIIGFTILSLLLYIFSIEFIQETMPRLSRKLRQLKAARQVQVQRCRGGHQLGRNFSSTETTVSEDTGLAQSTVDTDAHWEGYNSEESGEEECEVSDDEDGVTEIDLEQARNAFDIMMKASEGKDSAATDNRT